MINVIAIVLNRGTIEYWHVLMVYHAKNNCCQHDHFKLMRGWIGI